LLPLTAQAQQQVDQRTAATDMLALQAQIMALQVHLRADKEDAEAQKKTLWDWFLAAKAEAEAKKSGP
jgi:ribosomal protein S15P/S13E